MRPTNENICPSAIVDGSELTIRCTISIDAKEAVTRDFAKGIHLRIISRWLSSCVTSPNVFSVDDSWRTISHTLNDREVACENVEGIEPGDFIVREWTHSMNLPKCLGDENWERLASFNADPGVYAFVMDRDVKCIEYESETTPGCARLVETIVPIGLAYLDCSTFQFHNECIVSRSQKSRGIFLSVELKQKEPLFPDEKSVKLHPFVLNVETLSDYPLQNKECQNDALESCYIYGTIQIDTETSRKILASPMLVDSIEETCMGGENSDPFHFDEVKDEEIASVKSNGIKNERSIRSDVPVQFRSCVLPVLGDESMFKELLSSTTYELRIYNENIFNRFMNPKILEAYNNFLPWNSGKVGEVEQPNKADNKGGTVRRNITDLAHEFEAPNNFLPNGHPIHESDIYLIDRFWDALEESCKILHHGTVRFRMGKLLSSAENFLADFARSRNPDVDQHSLVIHDSIEAEVYFEKPSCPFKWKMPSKLSLRAVLEKHLSINKATGSGDEITTTNGENESRCQEFVKNKTRLIIRIEYHRGLENPEVASSVLGIDTLNYKRDAHDAFLQTISRTDLASTLLKTNALRRTYNYLQEKSEYRRKSDDGKDFLDPMKVFQQRQLQLTPFNRMVFVLEYDDNETLTTINNAITTVNLTALSNIQGSLRSYKFTEEEMVAAANADLDVVCGFSLMDDNERIIVIEGLAGPGKGMQNIYLAIPKLQPNSRFLKILCNPEVLFPDRLYTVFGPDIKRIRIRDNLPKLAQMPEIYDRNRVSKNCFEAIDKVMALKSTTDMKATKDMSMFPQTIGLVELELLYGEAISRIDLDGASMEKIVMDDVKIEGKNTGVPKNDGGGTINTTEPIMDHEQGRTNENNLQIVEKIQRCSPTDSHNEKFEKYLQNRPRHRRNYVLDNLKTRKLAAEQASKNRRLRYDENKSLVERIFGYEAVKDGKVKIHNMANNSRNFNHWAQEKLKEDFRTVKNVTFTYSRDFVSQTICLGKNSTHNMIVDEERKYWTTPSGFMTNKPRTKEELLKHPKRPSDGRIEDLRAPFDEVDSYIAKSRGAFHSEKEFKTRFETTNYFGMNKPIKFEREFDVKKVGNSQKLPRGKSIAGGYGDTDRDYWRSIFNGGEAADFKMKLEAAEEKKKWQQSVVVDSLTMKMGGFKVRDKCIPANRTKDILRDTPRKLWAKRLRDRRSVRGKLDLSYQEAPFTAMNIGKWVPNSSVNTMLRVPDRSKFVTTKDYENCVNVSESSMKVTKSESQTGVGKDFIRFINSKSRLPESQTIVVKKSAPLFSDSGVTGSHDFVGDPRWQRPQR